MTYRSHINIRYKKRLKTVLCGGLNLFHRTYISGNFTRYASYSWGLSPRAFVCPTYFYGVQFPTVIPCLDSGVGSWPGRLEIIMVVDDIRLKGNIPCLELGKYFQSYIILDEILL